MTYVAFVHACLRASRSIHRQLLKSVLGTTLRYGNCKTVDHSIKSPQVARQNTHIACHNSLHARHSSRYNPQSPAMIIINFYGTVDGPITNHFTRLVQLTVSMTIKFIAVVLVSPGFLVPGIVISMLGAWCGQVYLKAQLSAKRESSHARAPVLGHFGAAFAGISK